MSEYLKETEKLDTENLYQVLLSSHKQIEYALQLSIPQLPQVGKDFSEIIVSGLGGSAIAGDFFRNFTHAELAVPYSVNRNYSLPAYTGKSTLLIISSYSGNTEESIEAFHMGLKAGAKIVCLTTGGEIGRLSSLHNIPLIPLLSGLQPRYAFGVSFFTLLRAISATGALANQDEIITVIGKNWEKNGLEYASAEGRLKRLAYSIKNSIPVIYSFADTNDSVGYRLKCQFNENSKVNAFANVYPEFNHNEIVGWETYSQSEFATCLITIEEPSAHPQLQKRDKICTGLIKEKGVECHRLSSVYESRKERLADTVLQADWLSFHTAIARGKDPGEIDNIHFLKKELVG